MPTGEAKALLTDIGTEELAHWEMICAMVKMLMTGATIEEIKEADMGAMYPGFFTYFE
jgi:spore coat protein JC